MVAWFVLVAIAVAIAAVAIVMMPRAKRPKPDAATDLDDPTAEAGRPIPVPFGTLTIKGLNVVWFGEKAIVDKKVSA